MPSSLPLVSAQQARRALLRLQALGSPPDRSSRRAVEALVERLGYVQVDSINVLERAHHLILGARLEGYRHEHLEAPLERTRGLWEHWTHDASVIPTRWFPHWRHRFGRHAARQEQSAWWRSQIGPDSARLLRRTLARVRREGPLRARDFPQPTARRGGGWWNWHPEKAALEHLWRCGKLAISRRESFQKVYDLTERVLPAAHALPRPTRREHIAWACRGAIARLGIATPRELAHFFGSIEAAEARVWCAEGVRRGELVAVKVERAQGGAPVECVALPSWRELGEALPGERLLPLCPFDPVVRDRSRLLRLFGFEYRFEAFTPRRARVWGYYTMPLLEGDRLVGRIDPAFDRESGALTVRGPWWERGVAPTRERRKRLEVALAKLATQLRESRAAGH